MPDRWTFGDYNCLLKSDIFSETVKMFNTCKFSHKRTDSRWKYNKCRDSGETASRGIIYIKVGFGLRLCHSKELS